MDDLECSTRENEYKCYRFEAEISAKLEGYVYAHDKEEAYEYLERGQEDEVISIENIKIESVDDIEEMDDLK